MRPDCMFNLLKQSFLCDIIIGAGNLVGPYIKTALVKYLLLHAAYSPLDRFIVPMSAPQSPQNTFPRSICF